MRKKFRIGSRRSLLAQAQARLVIEALRAAHGFQGESLEPVLLSTHPRTSVPPVGGFKGMFTRALDEALMRGEVDMVVHSVKDVPPEPQAGLVMECCLKRGDPRDAYVGRVPLDRAAVGFRVGTSAPRRRALLQALWPHVAVREMRGNVDTRLKRLARDDVEGLILSVAGLERLGAVAKLEVPYPVVPLSVEQMVPAAAQGVIGVARRQDDEEVAALLAAVHDPPTGLQVDIERAFVHALQADCDSPVGAYAHLGNQRGETIVRFHGLVLSPDGSQSYPVRQEMPREAAVREARACGVRLRETLGESFFA